MSQSIKRNNFDNEKASYNSYNLNSFRVVSNPVEKNIIKKEKLNTPRVILQSVENLDKEGEVGKKAQIKPRLLTGKLPSAFGVKYRRTGSESGGESSPRKLLVNDNFTHHFNICVTEGDEATSAKTNEIKFAKKQFSAKTSNKRGCSGIFLSDSDSNDKLIKKNDLILVEDYSKNNKIDSLKQFTKPMIIKSNPNSHNQSRQVSLNKDKNIPINNFLINKGNNLNNINNSNNQSDSKSTGNNSQGSSQYITNQQANPNRISISRTHDAFFPKIKNTFDINEIDNNHISNQKIKFNSNNGINVGINMSKNLTKEFIEEIDIKLEDGISLSVIKNNLNKKVKKFFHVPNFEIYSIKEIPMSSKFFISNFREKLKNWKKNIGNSNRFIKIYNEYVNNPEGFISLVMDYQPGFSLQDIIENVGNVNESVLCKMSIQIVQCLKEYREKFNEDFVDFCSCDVLLDKSGNLKLMQKLIDHECNSNSVNKLEIIDIVNDKNKCKCFDHFHKSFKHKVNVNQYFDLGYILLISALGGINFDSLDYFSFNYSTLLKISYLKKCCLFHLIISMESSHLLNPKNKIKISNFINNKKFSDNFIDFLCNTLSFEKKNNINTIIINHPWIQINNIVTLNNTQNKVKVSMKELIKISRDFKKTQNTNNFNAKKFNNFLINFDIILSNNRNINKEELNHKIMNKKDVIKDLAYEFELNPTDLMNRLKTKVLLE